MRLSAFTRSTIGNCAGCCCALSRDSKMRCRCWAELRLKKPQSMHSGSRGLRSNNVKPGNSGWWRKIPTHYLKLLQPMSRKKIVKTCGVKWKHACESTQTKVMSDEY